MPDAAVSLLSASRLSAVIQSLQDVRELPGELLFLKMHPIVNRSEGEILARFVGRVQIADVIADDQKAAVYSFMRFQTEHQNIPNLKVGMNLTQAQLAQLNAITGNGGALTQGDSPFMNIANFMGDALLLGIRQRWESLFVAAYLDSFNYDRFGIKMTGTKFGTPSDLKPVSTTSWDNILATPVTDVWNVQNIARQKYGITYDRMIMSTAAFQYMIATTEFINRARVYFGINSTVTSSILGLGTPGAINVKQWETLSAPVLGLKEIVLYDARYWSQDVSGNEFSARFLPANEVILCSIANDGKPMVLDMGNAPTVESQVMNITPTAAIGTLPAGTAGPISYATPTDPNMNPPGITMWGVARSWPMKWQQQMNAAMNVGTFSDIITPGVPFPIP